MCVLSLKLLSIEYHQVDAPNMRFSRGGSRIRTYEDISQQIYSLPQLAALVFPQIIKKTKEQPLKKGHMAAYFSKEVQNYTLFGFIQIIDSKSIKNRKPPSCAHSSIPVSRLAMTDFARRSSSFSAMSASSIRFAGVSDTINVSAWKPAIRLKNW